MEIMDNFNPQDYSKMLKPFRRANLLILFFPGPSESKGERLPEEAGKAFLEPELEWDLALLSVGDKEEEKAEEGERFRFS